MKKFIDRLLTAINTKAYTNRLILYIEVANKLISQIRKSAEYLEARENYINGKGEQVTDKSVALDDDKLDWHLLAYNQPEKHATDLAKYGKEQAEKNGLTEQDLRALGYEKITKACKTCKAEPNNK